VTPEDQAKKPFIEEPVNGFPLIGADNTGKCTMIKTSLTDTSKTVTEYEVEDINDLKYFEDPLLTFDDSIVNGCHLDLNYDQLKTFCDNDVFNNLAIF